ncbi:NADH-quinone oxidoreductase subunit A [SCandidatus Aminicenantes bacterium Aminicenantia_JdfR_composite]|jgi:NADH-quinone oxidoreductase subunit A|nr:NADH-quinone oxidoreductase subunit A [SCandidatus Aminicenantes bacterium Aminicenantia_JdfR_composite]MCP2596757.1 NADH-quinone oxidoreductase subunit A [Candidatus Aminicenantes bacterium AC-335-G13]MCP2620449.1 NADH-quinone oxidoreductase subunit A [Candidatus Aminicenantes bacterium AC-334-E05]
MELFLLFIIVGLLTLGMLFIGAILGPKKISKVKLEPFECGSPLLQKEIGPFSIKYYMVALLFLIFDIEVAFLFPWALVFKRIKLTAFIVILAYFLVLIVGFIYAWKKGAFEWEE